MTTLQAEEAYTYLGKPDTIFVDVRTTGEFASAHIQGAINLPLATLSSAIPIAIPDTAKHIFLYCLSGSRSAQAAELLEHLGYTNTVNIQKGLLAWRMKKLPLVS